MRTLEDYVTIALGQCVETETDCWQFTGYCPPHGYGQVGQNLAVHRIVWEHFRGPIPDGLQLDHLCRNRPCCNPDHLEPVTSRVNVLRGVGFGATNAAKTHCDHGHELTPDNVYARPDRFGRLCRICRRDVGLRRVEQVGHEAIADAHRHIIYNRGNRQPSPLQRRLAAALGSDLDAYVMERRIAGRSWRGIADDLKHATGICPSDESLRYLYRWREDPEPQMDRKLAGLARGRQAKAMVS